MNRIKSILLFSVAMMFLCSCHDEIENDLNRLDRRITALETACENLNTNIDALRAIVNTIEGYDFVTGIKTNTDYEGNVIGYTISFTHSSPITLFNGESEETPIIGVRKADNGLYYWTVTYSTGTTDILDDKGVPVPATSFSPLFRIVDGKWQISYDNGEVWRSDYGGQEFGQATGDTPKSWFSSIVDSTDYIIFNCTDGSSFRIPTWSAYEKMCRDVEVANNNYSQLMVLFNALKAKVYAKSITPILSDADTTGYTLTLSDGTQMTFYNGVSTNRPELGASLDPEDSVYYWTIKYKDDEEAHWITYAGQKLRAGAESGVTPKLAVKRDDSNSADPNFYWMISYYESMGYFYLTDRNGKKIQASVNGSSCDEISVTADFVSIKCGGNVYRMARYQDFEVALSTKSVKMSASDTASFTFTIATGNSDFAVLPVAQDGFYAEATSSDTGKNWKVTVISPSTFTKGSSELSLIVSDGKGHMKTYSIIINFGA